MTKNPVIDAIRLDGGVPCLDFVNTIPDRVDGTNRDNLKTFDDLLYWARKAGILTSASFSALEHARDANERKAKSFFSEAIVLRSLIYDIFKPISQQQKVKSADLDTFNKIASHYFSFLKIDIAKNGFTEDWAFDRNDFHTITAPILKSGYELLLSDKLHRVKECPNCGWLFLDATKNGKRRWCSMQDCGSNVKALEYYYRQKEKKM